MDLFRRNNEQENDVRSIFSIDDFEHALRALDDEVGKSKHLKRVSPIRIVAVGGYVAVKYFHNRSSTQELDYFFDPLIEPQFKLEDKMHIAISNVGKTLGLNPKWCNDHVKVFALGNRRVTLFNESIDENAKLWEGKNLVIYAVKWEWVLDRKLKRLSKNKRNNDFDDCIAILHLLRQRNGSPLSRTTIKTLNTNLYKPIEDHTLDEVARKYKDIYQSPGIVDTISLDWAIIQDSWITSQTSRFRRQDLK